MNKKFFLDLIKEGIGYESGLSRTIVDLYKNPQLVVEASKRNNLTYINPVKFMMRICSYYIVINGFFIDWKKISLEHIKRINFLLTGFDNVGKAEMFYAQVMDFLFSVGLIPGLICMTILQLYFISKKTKNSFYSFDYHKDVLFYYNGLNVLLYFIFSLAAAFLNTDIFLIVYSIYIFLIIIGFRKVIELKPITAYFLQEKEELSKIYKKTFNKTFILFIISSILFLKLMQYLDSSYLNNTFFGV